LNVRHVVKPKGQRQESGELSVESTGGKAGAGATVFRDGEARRYRVFPNQFG
jgi:hypothetical protein